MRYVDTQIGRIIEARHENAIYANTLVTITADHGEAFGEHGRTGHGRTLYDEEVKVPLILHLRSRFATWAVIAQQVRLMDLAPTLVEVAGLRNPRSWEGISFASSLEPQAKRPSQQPGLSKPMILSVIRAKPSTFHRSCRLSLIHFLGF